MQRQWTSSIMVLVNDLPLDPLIEGLLERAVVENSMHLPDMFELTFNDPAREVVELGGFIIGSEVVLTADGGDEEPLPLMVGEITALELEFEIGGSKTIVRGLDASHRLFRGKKTRTFQEMLVSEIIEEILAESEVIPGEIAPTADPIQYLVQAGTTDWQFIQKLAQDCGYRAWMMDGLFNFAPVEPPVTGDVPGTLEVNAPTQLVLGQGLTRLRAVVRSTEQVEDVQVMGWSPLIGEPVVGVSPAESLGVEILAQPEELAAVAGANSFQHLWYPTDDEDAAETKAAAIGNQLAEAYAELEGESVGTAVLKAGIPVNLSLAGPPFDGGYTLSSTRHVFDPDTGYTTHFTVSGWQDRSMLSLAAGPSAVMSEPFRIPGVVSATVMNTRDPEEEGRVQLMFQWMGPEVISDWVRCLHMGVGEGSGSMFVPEPGTEVLVAFEQGDPSKPYVLGGLYSAVLQPGASPDLIDEATGLVNERRLKSRTLHNLTFYDGEEINGIMLQIGDETQTIFMNAEEDMLTISIPEGALMIQGADVTINASGDLMLNSEGSVLINGSAVAVTADEVLTVAGGTVAMAGDDLVTIDGPVVAING
jgi:phage protein D/uncharacterized Zn-binding protein involved in type VI secretion